MWSLFGQVYSNLILQHHLASIQAGVEETSEASGVDAEQERDVQQLLCACSAALLQQYLQRRNIVFLSQQISISNSISQISAKQTGPRIILVLGQR